MTDSKVSYCFLITECLGESCSQDPEHIIGN